MPKSITWDEDSKYLYEIGVDHGVLYLRNGAHGSYTNGIAWNGLTNITETPSGAEASKLYADNTKYIEIRSAEEFGGTIEAYAYPKEFEQCNGAFSPCPGLLFNQQPRRQFALSYRTKIGNKRNLDEYGYKIHLVYGALASPSEKSYQTTNDSPEAVQFSWEFSTTPILVASLQKPVSSIVIDSTKVSPGKLAYIEKILYGSEEQESRIMLPAEVVSIIENTTLPIVGSAIVGEAVV